MLPTTLTSDSIAAVAQLVKSAKLTQDQQEQIESTIGAIAQQNHWPRHRAAQWLDRQAA